MNSNILEAKTTFPFKFEKPVYTKGRWNRNFRSVTEKKNTFNYLLKKKNWKNNSIYNKKKIQSFKNFINTN